VVTASFFKNEEAFIKLAKDQNKLSGGVSRVILFKDQCQFSGLSI
jgi:hypothetical protein